MRGLLTALSIIIPTALGAQQNCGDADLVGERLQDTYGEQIVASGFNTQKAHVVEFWGSRDKDSFTIVLRYPNNVRCVVNAGSSFSFFAPLDPDA